MGGRAKVFWAKQSLSRRAGANHTAQSKKISSFGIKHGAIALLLLYSDQGLDGCSLEWPSEDELAAWMTAPICFALAEPSLHPVASCRPRPTETPNYHDKSWKTCLQADEPLHFVFPTLPLYCFTPLHLVHSSSFVAFCNVMSDL